MKKIVLFLIGLLIIGLAILTPFYFDAILYFTVSKIGFGWVVTTVLIRLLVIIFITFGIKFCLDAFKPKILKNWLLIIVGCAVGFSVGFAVLPIYDVDYFMQNDNLELKPLNELSDATNNTYNHGKSYEVLAFLDVGCSHCMLAAQRLGINFRAGQNVPIHLFFSGSEADVINFREKNNVSELTYHLLPNEISFIYFAGFEFPSIFLVNPEGEVAYHWLAEKLNYNALDYLLSLEQ
ncbi:hypothetical protein N8987_00800 [Crocinitomix sp.]|nr:hypothetical protein [Crocinitomix sp.]